MTFFNDDIIAGPVSADENKALHAVQTVGQLSRKTANRVYHSVAAQLKTVKKEDVATYISSVVSILHLTHFLNLGQKQVNQKEASNQTEGMDEEKEGKDEKKQEEEEEEEGREEEEKK